MLENDSLGQTSFGSYVYVYLSKTFLIILGFRSSFIGKSFESLCRPLTEPINLLKKSIDTGKAHFCNVFQHVHGIISLEARIRTIRIDHFVHRKDWRKESAT